MPVRQEVAQACHGKWKHELFESAGKAPCQCLYGCACTCCAVYQQRNKLLDLTGEPYVCCAGLCPCGPLGEPQADRTCLLLEAFCCPGWALNGNRFMIQTRFDRENTACDDMILTFTCLFWYAVQCARCICDVPEELEFLADCLVLSVDGCMHAQQHLEIQEIEKHGYQGPPPQIIAVLPPVQKQICAHGKHAAPATVFGASPGAAGSSRGTPSQQEMRNAPSSAQAQQFSMQQRPPMQQQMPQPMQQPMQFQTMQAGAPPVQVQCGACQQIFGSPSAGVTVACPFCGAHNMVPAGVPVQVQMHTGNAMYMGAGGRPQEHSRPGMAAVAGVGAGAIGGMMLADMLF